MFAEKKVLVVAAHPDDEMLGCGGTLARLRAAGSQVSVLLLGEGPVSRIGGEAASLSARAESRNSAVRAAASLGITDVRFAALPDNRFDSVPLLNVIKHVEDIAGAVPPDLVLTHFSGDLNIDHQLTHRAVMTAFRPLPGAGRVTILSFEVLSSTEYSPAAFQPNIYVDVTDFLQAKQNALAAYASEMRPWPHPRSHEAVEYLARLRGSQCGCMAAEGFALCRGVV